MGILTQTFGTDKSKESEGVWIDVAADGDTVARMRILRMGSSNKKFVARYTALTKKLRFTRGNKRDLELAASREAFIDGCLLDWENIENIHPAKPGEEKEPYMPFTKENAMLLFKALPDLFDLVVNQATELENFQSEVNEESAKNSFPSSNTN